MKLKQKRVLPYYRACSLLFDRQSQATRAQKAFDALVKAAKKNLTPYHLCRELLEAVKDSVDLDKALKTEHGRKRWDRTFEQEDEAFDALSDAQEKEIFG